MGRETYASFKTGMLKKQSMGYKAIQYEYVTESKRMVRNLIEVQVVEGSAVNFPMNDLAVVDTVKNRGKKLFFVSGKQKQSENKDFNDHYRSQQIDDWMCSDLCNITSALKQSPLLMMAMGPD